MVLVKTIKIDRQQEPLPLPSFGKNIKNDTRILTGEMLQ